MNWIERNSMKIIIAGILISFLVGAAIVIHAGALLRYPDEQDWTRLATNLVNEHVFTLDGMHATAFRPPGFALFLSLPIACGVGNVGLRFVNLSMFLLSEVLLALLARKLFSKFAAVVSVLLVLAYPVLLYTATILVPQTIGATLFLLAIWLLFRSENPGTWSLVLSAIVWGALLLTVPTFVLALLCITIWMLWKRRKFRRKVFSFAVPLILVVGSWTARNYVVFHSFFFVASEAGINLLVGNNENTNVKAGNLTNIDKYFDAAKGMSEVETDRFFRSKAVEWIKGNPGAAFRLYVLKVAEYFTFTERTGTVNYAAQAEQPFWRSLIMLFTYEPLLLLLIARVAIALKYPLTGVELLLICLYFLNAPYAAIFYTKIRYRIPMDWILLLIDAGMIQIIFSGLFSRREVADV